MLKRGFQFAPGYQLQEFLGRGQFGQVWRATAPGGAAAAVKFIDLSDGQGQKEYDGVRRVKQIRHANLMPITAIWLLDGEGKVIEEAPNEAIETIDLSAAEPRGASAVIKKAVEPSWLVVSMLLGGKSLQQRLRECIDEGLPGIPPKELISYMDESAKGIDFLNAPQHDLGEGPISIQHSDVKPANIVLIGSSAVVCDFGLARILTRNQVTATSAAGTPAYMAPEAISGKPARTSDQYSLAVTYYHLRTGALPVNDGSLWEVLDAHRQGKLKLGLVSEAEQEVLRKATDLNWENRFDTNVEMVDALRDALRAEGHTQPSFVPNGGQFPGTANTDTAAIGGEPTARLAPLVGGETTEVSPGSATSTVALGISGTGAVLKTLLLSDIVDSTMMVETLGDEGAAALFRLHDRAARDLLARFGGREIDKTDGFLMLFERPLNAALYAQAYHQALADLSKERGIDLTARVGIHIGEVILYENRPEDVARGAKSIEAEGLAKPMAARLMSLAQPKQTLVTRGFYDIAKRSAVGGGDAEKKLVWRTHGSYLFKGVEDPISVFEVGIEGLSPLTAPPDSAKVKRVTDDAASQSGAHQTVSFGGAAAADMSLIERLKSQPKMLAGAGGALMLLLLLGAIAIGGRGEPRKQPEGVSGGPGVDKSKEVIPVQTDGKNASQLFAEAMAKFESDEKAAITLFQKAVDEDPGLSVVPVKQLAGHKSPVMFADVTPDGKNLVTAADQPILWDMTSDPIHPTLLEGHKDVIEAVSLSPSGDRLVTVAYDNKPLVWNLTQADVASSALPLVGHADPVRTAVWHPTEPIIITTSSDPSIGVWQLGRATSDAPNGTVAKSNRFTTTETMKAAVIDRQGRWLVTILDLPGDSPSTLAYRWEDVIKTLTVQSAPPSIDVTTKSVKARKLAFASDSDNEAVLAVGDEGGSISLYQLADPPKPALSRSNAHTSTVEALRIVPGENSDVVVSGSSDGSVQWWQTGAANRVQKRTFGAMLISSVDVSADGRWVVAGSHEGSVWLWEPNATQPTAIQLPTGAAVHVVRFDPSSQWMMAGCEDGVVRVWDLKWAKLVAQTLPTPEAGGVQGPTQTIESQPLAILTN